MGSREGGWSGSGVEATWPPRSAFGSVNQEHENSGTPVLDVAFFSRRVVLEGEDLSLELLIEPLQFFLLAKDIVTIKRHLCPLAIRQ